MWHGFYGGGWPMLAGGVLFWGSIVCLAAWGIHRTTRHRDGSSHHGKSALDHLKERYAKGEISKTEYDEIRRDLLG
ncbi:SHOCT domain-containing protein [Candidatus Bipolaricaulota bacterium]